MRSCSRGLALGYGVVCHAAFALAVGTMTVSLWTGLAWGQGSLQGGAALVANTALLLQFPLLHSFLLSPLGKPWLHLLAPRRAAAALSTTVFAAVSSLQLLGVFLLWSPSGQVWWHARGVATYPFAVAFGASWVFLLQSMRDAGLSVQTGYLGWTSVFRGVPPRFPPLATTGVFRLCRQPIYLAFCLTLWTGPVWTPDRLLLAVPWTAYCLLGPRLKEQRLWTRHGGRFLAYRESVPYWIPWSTRRRG